MEQEQLNEILALHNAWLDEQPEGRQADLQGINLQWVNLHGASLQVIVLEGSDLLGANLQGTMLQGANLKWANLKWANLKWADLKEADFQGADLEGADLKEALLTGAVLKDANLFGADLTGTVVNHVKNLVSLGPWPIQITAEGMLTIGCKSHPVSRWETFSDTSIHKTHPKALAWWKVWKEPVLSMARAYLEHEAMPLDEQGRPQVWKGK